ncbi:MAG: hypothetical protein LBU88_01440 [Treponema sp.]|jgi:hypothetical protein|nr:hypothetical protein [Treponema sp.]
MKNLSFFVFVTILFVSCTPRAEVDRIYIRFTQPNFEGDWSSYSEGNNKIDTISISIPYSSLYRPPIEIMESIRFNNNKPSILNFNTNAYYASKAIYNDKYSDNIEYYNLGIIITNFLRTESLPFFYSQNTVLTNNTIFNTNLKIGTKNDISLNYSYRSRAEVSLETEFVERDNFFINDQLTYSPYLKPDIKYILRSNEIGINSINATIMAEGYRADQIRYFREYVEDIFKNGAPFNFIKNNNLRNNINMVMFETISLESGYKSSSSDNKNTYFQYMYDKIRKDDYINFNKLKDVFSSNISSAIISTYHMDVYILFVNSNDYVDYIDSYINRREINRKNNNPVHCIVINAPAGFPVNGITSRDFFHSNVQTDKIRNFLEELLGHYND